jgi:hypothetical protein
MIISTRFRGTIMKLRKWILMLVAAAITATSLSGCIVVPARGGYYYHDHDYHGWDHDRRY